MDHLNPEWQTPPGGDFARYVEQLNADAALLEAIERRRQAERQRRPSQGMTQQHSMQKKPALPAALRLPQRAPSVQRAPAVPQPATSRPVQRADSSSPAQTSAFVGKVILGVIIAFIALMLFADTEDGMDVFGFLIVAVIAWRVFLSGRRNKQ